MLISKKKIDLVTTCKIFFIFALCVHIFLVFSLIFQYLNPFFYDCGYVPGQGADFFAFYQAGYNVIFGLNPYNVYPGYHSVPYNYIFFYHPFVAFTYGVFFALFPPFTAYWIYVIINLLLIWYSCFLTYRICKALNKPKWVMYIATGMWLCFTPFYVELFVGQINLLVGILTFFSLYAEFSKKEAIGTFCWTLGSLFKTMPYLLIPATLSNNRSRKVAYNVIISIIATIVFPLAYIYQYLYFGVTKTGAFIERMGHGANFELRSIFYYLSVYFTGSNSWFVEYTMLLFIISFLVCFGLASIATIYSNDYLVSITLFVCAYFLVATGIFEATYTFLLPFLIMLWIRDDRRKKWFLIFIFLAIPTPAYIWNLYNLWDFPFILIFKLFKIIPTLCLFILLLNKAFKTPRQDNFKNSFIKVIDNVFKGFNKQEPQDLPNVFVEELG